MKVLFYRAKYGNWQDRFVALWTWGPHSHCELMFSDGSCFSASARDGGTRFKKITFLPERWSAIEIDIEDEEPLRDWCRSNAGLGYDWRGIAWFLPTPLPHIEDRNKWYCSEICAVALRKFLGVRLSSRLSPNGLYRKLLRRLQS